MAVYSRTYYGTPGLYDIVIPDLAYVNILMVAREGAVHNQVLTTPAEGSKEFYYEQANGRIVFPSLSRFTSYVDPAATSDLDTVYERVLIEWRV